MTREDRERSILVLAANGRVQNLNADDLEALTELAEDDDLTLAELLSRRDSWASCFLISRPADFCRLMIVGLAEVA